MPAKASASFAVNEGRKTHAAAMEDLTKPEMRGRSRTLGSPLTRGMADCAKSSRVSSKKAPRKCGVTHSFDRRDAHEREGAVAWKRGVKNDPAKEKERKRNARMKGGSETIWRRRRTVPQMDSTAIQIGTGM